MPDEIKVYAKDNSKKEWTGETARSEASLTINKTGIIPVKKTIQLKCAGRVMMHSFENSVSFQLKRISDGAIIAEKKWVTESELVINETIPCSIKTGTAYLLKLHAVVVTGDSPGAISELNITIL